MSKVHYHFDHVGSYLRPQALKEAREKFADGDISQDELLKVQDVLKPINKKIHINSMELRHVQPTFVSMVRLLKTLIILSIATLNILNQ